MKTLPAKLTLINSNTQEEFSYECTITEKCPFSVVLSNDGDNFIYQDILEKINSLEYAIKVENTEKTLQPLDPYYLTKNIIERKSSNLSI